jgi:hypothetical protein
MHSLIVSQDGTFRTDLEPSALDAVLSVPANVTWLDIEDPAEADIALREMSSAFIRWPSKTPSVPMSGPRSMPTPRQRPVAWTLQAR